MNRKDIGAVIKANLDSVAGHGNRIEIELCDGYQLVMFRATRYPLKYGQVYVELIRLKDNSSLGLAEKYPANCMPVTRAAGLIEAYFAKKGAQRLAALEQFTVAELQAALARKHAMQPEAWTDGTDGTPYLWTAHITAKDAVTMLGMLGIKCSTVKVERNAYAVARASDDRFLSQEAIGILHLVG